MVYMDHNATSTIRPEVLDRLEDLNLFPIANPSSPHAAGAEARKHLDSAREKIAKAINCKPTEIYFTSGGTEANNMAILGYGTGGAGVGHTVVSSSVEHPSVVRTADYWSAIDRSMHAEGGRLRTLDVDDKGKVSVKDVERILRDVANQGGRVALLCLMHGNNETGIIQPIQEVSKITRNYGVTLHVDACQTLGKIAVDVEFMSAGMLSMSAHKIGGPKGIGAIYIRDGIEINPLMRGGHQERGYRPGTENVAGAVGFGVAVDIAMDGMTTEYDRLEKLRDKLSMGLQRLIADVEYNTIWPDPLPHVLNMSFLGTESDVLLHMLSDEEIYVSDGSACESGQLGTSKVLKAMGRTAEEASSVLRFSLGWSSTEEDVDIVLETLPRIVEEARKVNAY